MWGRLTCGKKSPSTHTYVCSQLGWNSILPIFLSFLVLKRGKEREKKRKKKKRRGRRTEIWGDRASTWKTNDIVHKAKKNVGLSYLIEDLGLAFFYFFFLCFFLFRSERKKKKGFLQVLHFFYSCDHCSVLIASAVLKWLHACLLYQDIGCSSSGSCIIVSTPNLPAFDSVSLHSLSHKRNCVIDA